LQSLREHPLNLAFPQTLCEGAVEQARLRAPTDETLRALVRDLPGQSPEATDKTGRRCAAIATCCDGIWESRCSGNQAKVKAHWEHFRHHVLELDLHLRTILLAVSYDQARGYQLGRGLAELYWQLDTIDPGQSECPPPWTSWASLEGDAQRLALSRLLSDLSGYLGIDHGRVTLTDSTGPQLCTSASPREGRDPDARLLTAMSPPSCAQFRHPQRDTPNHRRNLRCSTTR